MKINYFAESAYLDLFDSIKDHKSNYTLEDNSWIFKYFGGRDYYKESRIECVLPTLDATNGEDTNVIAFYEALKDKLSPKQASNPFLWSYLAHIDYWKYTTQRWVKDDMSIDTIRQRFFCNTVDGNRIGFLRNSISRLWWIGYMSYRDDVHSNPYELTKLLTSKTDICQSIIERNFSMNKNITIGILEAILKINNDPNLRDVGRPENWDGQTNDYEWRHLCKYLNRYGAVSILDALSSNEICELSYNYILEQRNK